MLEKFHWTSPSGVEIVLPHMNKMPAGVIRKHRKSEPVDFVFSVLEDVSDDATIAEVDKLSLPEVNDLFEAWQGAAATVGESLGSST
jgi:hypothetical protein